MAVGGWTEPQRVPCGMGRGVYPFADKWSWMAERVEKYKKRGFDVEFSRANHTISSYTDDISKLKEKKRKLN